MHTITETKLYISDKNKKVRSAYVRFKICIYHMLNETQQKPNPRRQHSTHKKKRMKTNDVQIEIEKGKDEKKKI